MDDRVRELETTISELQSTVRGLTEELVETKDRLRELEAELDVEAERTDGGAVVDPMTEPESDGGDGGGSESPELDDIIVA